LNYHLIQQCNKSRRAGSVKRYVPWKKHQLTADALTCNGSVSRAVLFFPSQNLPFESDIGEDDDDSLLEPVLSTANETAERKV